MMNSNIKNLNEQFKGELFSALVLYPKDTIDGVKETLQKMLKYASSAKQGELVRYNDGFGNRAWIVKKTMVGCGTPRWTLYVYDVELGKIPVFEYFGGDRCNEPNRYDGWEVILPTVFKDAIKASIK